MQVWEGLYCPITPDKGLSRTDTANRPVKYTGRAAKGLGLAQNLGSDRLVILGRKRYSTCLKELCCTAFDHVVKYEILAFAHTYCHKGNNKKTLF